MKALILALAALLWTATPAPAQVPVQTHMYGLEEFYPTAFHETVYHMMEFCTGVSGDYQSMRWYIAKTIVQSGGIDYLGIWHENWGWPAIVLDREYVFDGEVVSHEIMHDLYKGQGPMDTYRRCVLEWSNLTRTDPPEDPADAPDGPPFDTKTLCSSGELCYEGRSREARSRES